MRKRLALAATLAALALPAAASDRHRPAPTAPEHTPSASQIGGAGGAGGAGGNAQSNALAAARASATGGAARSSAQGGRASAAGGSAYSGGNSQSLSSSYQRSAPAIFAPSMTTSNDTCAGSSTGGGSGTVFGIVLGTTWEFENCNRRANANQALRNGNPAIAHEIMCQETVYRGAAARAGQPCAADVPVAASVQTVSAPAQPSYCQRVRGESTTDRLNREQNCRS